MRCVWVGFTSGTLLTFFFLFFFRKLFFFRLGRKSRDCSIVDLWIIMRNYPQYGSLNLIWLMVFINWIHIFNNFFLIYIALFFIYCDFYISSLIIYIQFYSLNQHLLFRKIKLKRHHHYFLIQFIFIPYCIWLLG